MKHKLTSLNIVFLLLIYTFNPTQITADIAKDEKQILTIEKSLAMTLSHNSHYKSKIYLQKSKKKEVDEANANYYYPNIELGTKYIYQQRTPESTFPLPPHNISTSLSINKVIYSFGRLGDQVSIAEKKYEIARLEAYKTRNDLTKNVKIAFYTVLLNQQDLKVIYEGHLILKESLKYQENNYKSGKTPKFDYLRVKIQYENDKIVVNRAKEKLIKSINQLFTLIGIKLIGSLRELNYKIRGNFNLQVEGSDKQIILSLENSIHRGKSSRVEILKLLAQKRILSLSRDITSSQWKPVLTAFGNVTNDYTQSVEFTTSGFGLSDFDSTTNWNVGVQLTISLSDLLIPNSKARSKAKSFEEQVRSSQHSIKNLMSQIEQEIAQNYLSFKESETNIKRRKTIMKLSKESFMIAKRKYDAGTLDYLNYRDVDLQYRQAQLAYYRELYTYKLAYINLLDSMGITTP